MKLALVLVVAAAASSTNPPDPLTPEQQDSRAIVELFFQGHPQCQGVEAQMADLMDQDATLDLYQACELAIAQAKQRMK
jgi:hypothetical protein